MPPEVKPLDSNNGNQISKNLSSNETYVTEIENMHLDKFDCKFLLKKLFFQLYKLFWIEKGKLEKHHINQTWFSQQYYNAGNLYLLFRSQL